ncbi:MAG TPA: hypothetical protein VFZ09_27575 [Archangium sp.]|uniref:hypothetical protein n=1 Tax=Archangium sp. TaxID=1872627 RepID=UPI002E2ED580|nr:hypothetical protein [Archangium sp.]HEX5750021.1 hypothetical protein [Archangium sp.]
MSLRDVELDVALLLEAAGLGSTSANPPTLYPGPYPATAPDAFIACRHSGAEKPEKYLANTGLAYHRESVTVMVRGTREPGSYVTDGARARAAWSALYDLHPSEYVLVDPEDGGPTYLGDDEEHRPRWSFTVGLEYLSATAPGVVVPLSRDATLRVGGLSVTGEASVAGLLRLGALPFASLPAPGEHRGALVFDTDAGLLRVSTGTTWLALGELPPIPTAAEVLVIPAGELAASTVQGALEEIQADVSGRATAAQLAAKADASAVNDALALKANASALTSHTSVTAAHGVVGSLVGTTDAQTLSNKKHSGVLEVVDVASGAVAFRIPAGSWLKLGADTANADVLLWNGSRFLFGPAGGSSATVGSLIVGTEVVLQGGVLRRSTTGLLSYSSTPSTVAHRFTTSAVMAAGGVLVEFTQPSGTGGAEVRRWAVDRDGKPLLNTGDSSAAPGNATLNTPAGKSAILAGASSVTITNSCCTASSLVRVWVQQVNEDATLVRVRAVPAAGSFIIYGNASATANVVVGWEITN